MSSAAIYHEEYEERLDSWCTARAVIAGEDTVKAAGEDYLPRLDSQDDTEYLAYKRRAKFFNAAGRTLDGLHGMLFRKRPELIVKNPSLLMDADLMGQTLETYVQEAAREVLTPGRAGTLVDWSADESRAYLAFYRAESICNWMTTRIKGKTVLSLLALSELVNEGVEGAYDPNSAEEAGEVFERLRVIQLIEVGARHEATVTLYRRKFSGDGRERKGTWEKEGEPAQLLRKGTPLNFIPFVFHNATSYGAYCCKPPLEDLIKINLHHYRLSADYDHALFFAANPTAWVAGFPKESKLRIGSSFAWVTDQPDAKAGFLEFTGQGLNPIKMALDDDKAEMAILGARLIEPQKRDAETAETARIRQAGDSSILSTISANLSESMTRAVKMAHWWENSEASPEDVSEELAEVELNRDFVESRMAPDELRELVSAWMKGAISQDTLLDNLRTGEIIGAEIENEDEKERIEASAPLLRELMGIENPAEEEKEEEKEEETE